MKSTARFLIFLAAIFSLFTVYVYAVRSFMDR